MSGTPDRYDPWTTPYADLTTEAEVREVASRIACARSPENISCDGEASYAQIRRAHAFLNRHEQALARAGYRIGLRPSTVREWCNEI